MQSDEAIKRLKRKRAEFEARGVRSLAIFGSTARNEARADSDVDIVVELDVSRHPTLFDLSNIKFYIADLLRYPSISR
jgi:predicted nucleotidyltransferase